MNKLLIIDDHKIFTDGIGFLIEHTTDLKVVGVLHTGKNVLHFLLGCRPDIILLDIDLPDINGFEIATLVKNSFPEIKILALSMLCDINSIEKMIDAGADGFCVKSEGRDELFTAIQTLKEGGRHLPASYLRRMISKHDRLSEDRLTTRETEIIRMICDGKSSTDIASRLFLSTRTVETHRRNIYRKVDVHNNVELVNYARKHLII
jgi:DNA-binding NarL/FixJ family response regulator